MCDCGCWNTRTLGTRRAFATCLLQSTPACTQADRRARADRRRGRRGVGCGRVRADREWRASRAAVQRARVRRAARRVPHPRRARPHPPVLQALVSSHTAHYTSRQLA